jgi:hypothetical protein
MGGFEHFVATEDAAAAAADLSPSSSQIGNSANSIVELSPPPSAEELPSSMMDRLVAFGTEDSSMSAGFAIDHTRMMAQPLEAVPQVVSLRQRRQRKKWTKPEGKSLLEWVEEREQQLGLAHPAVVAPQMSSPFGTAMDDDGIKEVQ